MTKGWGKALAAYKAVFGKSPDLADFSGRLRFQKTVYMLKLVGVNFGKLNFTWYNRGPYSFEIAGLYPTEKADENSFTQSEKNKVDKYRYKLIEFLDTEKNAELFSSVAFLLNEEKLSVAEVVQKMWIVKPWFSKEQVEDAIRKINLFLANI